MGKAINTCCDNMGYFNPPNVYRPAIIDIRIVGEYSAEDGATNTYRITQNDGKVFEFDVKNGSGGSAGRSVTSVEQIQISTESLGKNIARIHLSDGTYTDVEIRNGAQGLPGPQGDRGPAGIDQVEATVDNAVGTPSVDTSVVDGKLHLDFHNMKGVQGEPAVGIENYVTVEATAQTTAATDVLPATGSADTLYRVACWDGAQYDTTVYSVYGWYNGAYKFLEKKEVGIDDEPTANSQNLVKSGGVAEKISQLGQYEDSPEFLRVVTDNDGRILYGVKIDGDFYFAYGIPSQVESEIDQKFQDLKRTKVEKEEGKELVTKQYMQESQSDEFLRVLKDADDKLLEANKIDGTKVFFGDALVRGKGVFEKDVKILGKTSLFGAEISFCESPEWLLCVLDGRERVLGGFKKDATFFAHNIQSPTIDALRSLIIEGENSIPALIEAIGNNASYHRIHPHGPALFFIDDDGGQYFPDIWDEIMGRTGIRVGIACIAGMMSGAVTPLPAYIQMPISKLREYYEAGCEVYSHSWSHYSFRNMTDMSLLDEECRKSKDWLMSNGFTRNADAIVYPGGMNVADSPAKKDVIRRYYRYGVATIDSYEGVNREPLDELFISRCQGDAWSLERLKGLVDVAVSEKKMLGVMTHAYELMGYGSTPYSDNKQENIDRIVAMIEYAQSKGVNIRPMEEIIHQIYGWDFRSNVF